MSKYCKKDEIRHGNTGNRRVSKKPENDKYDNYRD